MFKSAGTITALALLALSLTFFPALAGLDLENQKEVPIGALDIDHDGRIQRVEAAKYMFFYFDRDGNEVLTKGEYHRKLDIELIPYEGEGINIIDLDGDGQDDQTEYTLETFLQTVMIGDYDPEEKQIKAFEMMDIYFSRLDTDKSRAIELDEWQKHYLKYAVKKPNLSPKNANNDYYQN